MSESIAAEGHAAEQIKLLSLGHDFLVQICNHCKQVMSLAAGDIIYGENWYHDACWREIQDRYPEV